MGDQQSKNKNKKEHNKKLTEDPPPGFLGGGTARTSQCKSMFGKKGVIGSHDGVEVHSIQIQGKNSPMPSAPVRQLLGSSADIGWPGLK